MADGTIIKAFLASVGFAADETSLRSTLGRVAGFGLAVKMVTAGIYAGLLKAASGEAEMARQAERFGSSTKQLKELEYVAAAHGKSFSDVNAAMQALVDKNPRIKDAAQALYQVGERMRGLGAAQQRVYAKRLGIDESLIPMLTSDVAALRREFAAMYAVAGTDSKKAASESKALTAEFGKLTLLGKLLAQSVTLPFIAGLRENVSELRKTIMDNYDRIRRVMEGAIGLVLRVSGAVSAAISRIIKVIVRLAEWYDSLEAGQQSLVAGLAILLAAWKLFNLGFLFTPLGMIIAGFATLLLLIEDYVTWLEGGKSKIDWSDWSDDIQAIIQGLRAALPYLATIVGLWAGQKAIVGLKKINAALVAMPDLLAVAGRGFSGLFALIAAHPVFALIMALVLLLTHLDEVGQALDAGREQLREWGGDLREAVGMDRDAPSYTDTVEVEHNGKKVQMSRAQAMRSGFAEASDLPTIKSAKPAKSAPAAITQADGQAARLANLQTQAERMNVPQLTPGPATAASIDNSVRNRNLTVKSDTQINISSSDPAASGRQVEAHMNRVNADLIRNTKRVAQ